MARQIILQPNKTSRQQAFNDGFQQINQSIADAFGKRETDRQRAFQQAMGLRQAGYDVNPEQLQEASYGNVSLQDVLSKRTPEYEQALQEKRAEKERQREWEDTQRGMQESQFMQKMEDAERQAQESQLPFEQTRDYQKMKAQYGLMGDLEKRKQQYKAAQELAGGGKNKELGVRGYSLNKQSGVVPTKKEASDLRAATENASAFKNNIDNVADIIKKNKGVPSAMFNPNVHDTMKQELRKAQLDLKGDAFFKLGVLAGPDMQLIEEAFGDIDSTLNTWQPNSMEIALEKLENLKNYVDNKVKSKAFALGYDKSGSMGDNKSNGILSQSKMDIPYSPVNAPQAMPEAMAGQEIPDSAIVAPERTQMRRSRIQELRAKAQGQM